MVETSLPRRSPHPARGPRRARGRRRHGGDVERPRAALHHRCSTSSCCARRSAARSRSRRRAASARTREAVELIAAGANRVGATQIAPLLETGAPVRIDEVPVDQVGVAARVAWLAKRSIKTTAKAEGLRLALSMIDLTTLEGKDSDGKVRRLVREGAAARPVRPDAAAVRRRLRLPDVRPAGEGADRAAAGVRVASVATAFPSGHAPLATRIAEVEAAVADGADEIDMVIDRGAFLSGPVRRGRRRDRAGEGGLRRRAPEGDPRDGRAGDARQRPPRLAAGDAARRRLHQDVDRQGRAGGDARRWCS